MQPENLLISSHIADDLKKIIEGGHFSQIAVLVDENTRKHCLPYLEDSLKDHELIQIQSGEINKNLQTCELIWNQLSLKNFDRKSLLINVGGGVICDIGGFVAATYKRGIHFLHIPTTLLAQVDASIGGKTGIDFQGYKNQIGLFREPFRILTHILFLKTLPDRELKSGFAEVIKHFLIADKDSFETIEDKSIEDQNWDQVVRRSISIKQNIVLQDPLESGLRKSLNFGHSIGHALESWFMKTNEPLLHGEAIAIGLICEAYLSKEKIGLSEDQLSQITAVINKNFGIKSIPAEAVNSIPKLLLQDKKNEGGEILFTLIPEIGKVSINQVVSIEEAQRSITYYNTLSKES